MKKLKLTLILSAFLVLHNTAIAQTVHGCVLPGSNVIYTNQVSGSLTTLINTALGGAPLYHSSPTERLTNPNCFYKSVSSTRACKVCPTGFTSTIGGLITGCSSTLLTGHEGTYIVECDLDGYGLAMLSFIGLFGIRHIRKIK